MVEASSLAGVVATRTRDGEVTIGSDRRLLRASCVRDPCGCVGGEGREIGEVTPHLSPRPVVHNPC